MGGISRPTISARAFLTHRTQSPSQQTVLGRRPQMRKYLLLTSAVLLIAEPAAAKDGSFYTGLEFGLTFPKKPPSEVFVDYTTTNKTLPDEGATLPPSIQPWPEHFTHITTPTSNTEHRIPAVH